jgi:hypothetical protein
VCFLEGSLKRGSVCRRAKRGSVLLNSGAEDDLEEPPLGAFCLGNGIMRCVKEYDCEVG